MACLTGRGVRIPPPEKSCDPALYTPPARRFTSLSDTSYICRVYPYMGPQETLADLPVKYLLYIYRGYPHREGYIAYTPIPVRYFLT